MSAPSHSARRIFLCHSQRDEEEVRKLYHCLLREGFQPFMAEEHIGPGDRWLRKVRKEIFTSHFFLACVSSNWIDKDSYFYDELNIALGIDDDPEDVYIVPVRLEKCELPRVLRKYSTADVFTPGGLDKLVSKLRIESEKQIRRKERMNRGGESSRDSPSVVENSIAGEDKLDLSSPEHSEMLMPGSEETVAVNPGHKVNVLTRSRHSRVPSQH